MGDGVLSSVLPVRAKARIAPGHISAFPLLLCVCVRRVCVSLSLLFFLPSPLVFPPPNPVQRSLFRLFSPSSVLSQCMGPVSVAVCGRSGVIVYRLARLCMSLVAMLSRALSPLSLSFPAPSVPEYSGPVRRPPPSSRLVRPISKTRVLSVTFFELWRTSCLSQGGRTVAGSCERHGPLPLSSRLRGP